MKINPYRKKTELTDLYLASDLVVTEGYFERDLHVCNLKSTWKLAGQYMVRPRFALSTSQIFRGMVFIGEFILFTGMLGHSSIRAALS